MPFDLVTASRTGLHALFDARDADVMGAPELEALEALAAAGRVLLFADALDGETSWRIHVDEAPDEAVLARASGWVRGARLRIPSGVLRAAGVGEISEDEVSLPAGDYVVDAFTAEWGEAHAERRRARVGVFADWWYRGGYASAAALGVVGSMVALAALEPWQAGLVALAGAAAWFGWARPLQMRTRAVDEAVAQAFPEVVVMLRPLTPDEPRDGAPGVLVPQDARSK